MKPKELKLYNTIFKDLLLIKQENYLQRQTLLYLLLELMNDDIIYEKDYQHLSC